MDLTEPVFFDTTILLGGTIEFDPDDDDAQRVMAAIAAGRIAAPRTAWHCCLEYFSVATRLPEEFRLEAADALLLLEEEILGRFEVVDLPADRRLDFLRESAAENVVGGRVYDRHIGTVALESRCGIVVTENRRHFEFLAAHGVRVLGARELLEQLDARPKGKRGR